MRKLTCVRMYVWVYIYRSQTHRNLSFASLFAFIFSTSRPISPLFSRALCTQCFLLHFFSSPTACFVPRSFADTMGSLERVCFIIVVGV